MQDSIVTGIVSGLLTSALLFVWTVLWKKQISPWIENLLYRDAHIEGAWTGILIPHIGVEEFDKIREKHAWLIFKQMTLERKMKGKKVEKEDKSSKNDSILPQYDTEGKVVGEIFLPEKTTKEQGTNEPQSEGKRVRFTVTIKASTNRN